MSPRLQPLHVQGLKSMGVHMLGAPHLLKAPLAPKIAAIHIQPVKMGTGETGAKVTHILTNGRTKGFIFADPNKVGTHIARIERSEWRDPQRDPAVSVLHDIGETAG